MTTTTKSTERPQLVWLRRDLRLADQAAFAAALDEGPTIAVYVLDDERPGEWTLGGAARWWLHHSLESLGKTLADKHIPLVLRRGDAVRELAALAEQTKAGAIHALRHADPWWARAEDELATALQGDCKLVLHEGTTLAPVGSVVGGSGQPYRIYTPFARALMREMPPPEPTPVPHRQTHAPEAPRSDDLARWHLLPTKPDWSGGFGEEWTPGEAGAAQGLKAFAGVVGDYGHDRNLPAVEGTSRLSPHLHWGEISAAQVWHGLARQRGTGAETYRGELAWRDYAQNVIAQWPRYADKSANPAFANLQWRTSKRDLTAWQRGRTGYPVVDAGMRQLWTSGWMHNRVRMIAASFLVKHLLIDWREGERWFWDTLVDADYGNNAVNWQWVAGSGVDANMFGRIMAPLVQSEKFDAGDYIRRWVPELAKVADNAIHDPGEVNGYPAKLIDHRAARERALEAWGQARAATKRD